MNGSSHKQTNGNNQGENVLSLEMEALHPEPTTVRYPEKIGLMDQLILLVKLYLESYPRTCSVVGFWAFCFCIYAAVEYSKPPLHRNHMTEHYSEIAMDYNFKMSQIDHWCLFGGDDACHCEDFTEPESREEHPGWLAVHEANKKRIGDKEYALVFLGDDLVENLNGLAYNEPIKQSKKIQTYFNETFVYEAGASIDSIALGITGDSASNLLWRMDHGELPERMEAWVFWLVLGTSDLSRGGCSEEATVLGILRVAEELEQRYPGSVVVIQGILPRTSRKDGILEPKSMHTKLIGKHHTEKYYADMAQHAYLLWPSIQVINSELEKFCEGRENIVYFDAGRLFLQDVKEKKMGKTQKIITKLMPDYVHPSPEGWMVLGEAILEEYQTIVLDENMENDIERKEEDDDAR